MAVESAPGEGLAFCETDIVRILRTLGLQTVNRAEIQAVFRRTPPNKRKFAIGILKQLNQQVAVRDELHRKQAHHEARRAQKLEEAQVRVSGTAYAGTRVRIGEADLMLSEDLDGPTFQLADGGCLEG